MGVKGSSINVDSQAQAYMTMKASASKIGELAQALQSDVKALESLSEYSAADAQTQELIKEAMMKLKMIGEIVGTEKFGKLINIIDVIVGRATDIQTRSNAAHSASADKLAEQQRKLSKR